MPKLTRRGFLATSGAALSVKAATPLARSGGGRRILTLVYDKAAGAMRAVERVIH